MSDMYCNLNTSMNKLKLLAVLLLAILPSLLKAQLVVNEISQGTGGTKEYIEFVVNGTRTCSKSSADLRNWIVDDNNGWLGSGVGQGIAAGCLRFANDANWSNVPYGSIILLYDDANKNSSISLPDDPTDANNDLVYIVPVSSLLIEKNTTSPTVPSSPTYTYPTTGFTPGGDWSLIGLANFGDGVITVAPTNLTLSCFSFGYGTISNPAAATVYISTAGSGRVYYLSDNLFTTSSSWIVGNGSADETPGMANSALNAQWITDLKQTSGGIIAQNQITNLQGCGNLSFNGVNYTSSTVIRDTLKTTGGCDSIYIITNISIDNTSSTSITTELSGCANVVYNGTTYTSSTIITDTIKTVNGCDSIYNITNIRVVNPTTQTTFLRGCGSVVYNGITYTTNRTFRDTVKSVLGCDSLIHITRIQIQNVVPVYQNTAFSACRSVVYNGVTYTVSTNVKDTLRSTFGCDSVYRTTAITIQDIAPLIQTIFLADCDSVVYNFNTYTSTITTKDTIRSIFGCDSILINLNIRISGKASKDSITLIGCDTVSYNGNIYVDSIIIRDTLKTVFGCDSIYKIANILVKHLQATNKTDTLLACNTITFNGIVYTDSATVLDTLKSKEGCDSIYRTTFINLQKINPLIKDSTLNGCLNLVYNGITYLATTNFTDTIKTTLGCDSVLHNIHINIRNLTPITTHDTLSACNKVLFNGVTYTSSAIIRDTVKTNEGCDSFYNLIHIIIKVTTVTQSNSFSSCSSIFYNGINYTSSTIVRDTIRNASGCDSIYKVMTLTIQNTQITNNIILAGCDSVLFKGIVYTTSKVIRDTVRTAQFCDSIYNITNIVVKHITPISKTDTIKGCNSIIFNGITYTTSTIVLDTLKTPEGCDSVYRTNHLLIKLLVPVTSTTNLTGCKSLVYNGVTYNTSSIVNDTIRTISGCDSLYKTININIVSPTTANNMVTGCQGSVIFNGVTYTTSTTVLDTIKTNLGCDSIYRTNQIIVENITPNNKVTNLSGCGSVLYNGITYTVATVLKDTIKSVGGCDSIYRTVNISIVITPVTNSNTLNGCGSVTFNSNVYTSSTIVNDTIRTAGGCDSIYTITSINVQNITPTKDTIIFRGCNGSVVFNGITYTTSTIIKDTIKSSLGCDSIYKINKIIVENIVPITKTITLIDCKSIVYNGVTYVSSSLIKDTVRTQGGCDSIIKRVSINIYTAANTTVNFNGCNSLTFNGITYTTSTTIKDTVKSVSGCDSIRRTINITIQTITPVSGNNIVAGCNSVTFNGVTYTASTVVKDTLKTTLGCDSIFRTNFIVVQFVTPVANITTLYGCGSLTYHGITYTASTVVSDTTKSIAGCDSLFNTTTINIITPLTIVNNIQGCNSLVFNGITYTNSAVVSDTLKSITGCDSLLRTNNIIIQQLTPTRDTVVFRGCQGSVNVNGISYTSSVILLDTIKSSFGCDSIFKVSKIIVENISPIRKTITLIDCKPITYNGITYVSSSFIRDTLKTLGGCDSIWLSVSINIYAPTAQTLTIRGCNSTTFNGITYSTSTIIKDTVKSNSGCDSIRRTINIIIQQITPVPGSNLVAGCNNVIFNGVTYTASTTVLDTLRTTLGCDSIFRINYIVVQFVTPVANVTTLYGCGSLTYHGITYTASSVVSDTTRSIGGCDSLYNTTTINIVTPIATVNNVQGCNSLVFNGVTYTNSAVVSDTVKSITGCDSLYRTNNINIQIITPVNGQNVVAGCNSVTFNGITYTTSTTVLDTLRTTLGCDSIFRTNYIVVQFITPVVNVTTLYGCGSLTYHGITYTASTVVSDTTRSIGGCDSLYNTTTINIVTPIATVNNIQGCNSLVFNGVTYTNSAVVSDTVKSTTGCDSLYRTNNINIQITTPVNGQNVVAGCNSVTFNGITFTTSTTVLDTLRTTLGCDSIFRTNYIVVQFVTPVANVTTLYGCGSLTYHGITYTASTVISDTTKSIGGCDSLYNTTTINIVIATTVTNTLQGCNSLVFNGVTYTTSSVLNDTTKSMTGCDSIYTITNINIQQITPVPGTNQIRACNSTVFNGVTYTTSTVVLDTLRTTVGCDSIFRTNYITIQSITPVTIPNALTGCRSVMFNGITYTASTLINDTVRSSFGCDSIYNVTTITVNNLTLSITANPNPVIVGTNVTLTTSATVPYTIQGWSPAYLFANQTATSQTIKADSARDIYVYGISNSGCGDTAEIRVNIRYLDQIFIPNTFTPNNDGRNDEFRLYGNNIAKAEMKIFNQWGQLIFESSDQYKGWNGYFKGQLQPVGVYVYVMKVTLTDNTVLNRKGSINLVR